MVWIKTDEFILIQTNQTNLIEENYKYNQHHDEGSLQDQQTSTIRQKYDLVSKN